MSQNVWPCFSLSSMFVWDSRGCLELAFPTASSKRGTYIIIESSKYTYIWFVLVNDVTPLLLLHFHQVHDIHGSPYMSYGYFSLSSSFMAEKKRYYTELVFAATTSSTDWTAWPWSLVRGIYKVWSGPMKNAIPLLYVHQVHESHSRLQWKVLLQPRQCVCFIDGYGGAHS